MSGPPGTVGAMTTGILRPYQARTLLGLLHGIRRYRGETLTVMFPRQSGKNEVSSRLVAALLLSHARTGGSIVACAPTLWPQGRISFDRTRIYLDALARHLPAGVQPRSSGDSSIAVGRADVTFLSASPAAHVAGHTASIALIADEAQDIDAGWFERQFRPMAASTGAPAVMFGTAWDGQTLLERAADRNRRLDREDPGAVPRHHQAGWREVGDSLPAYRTYVEQEMARLGPAHPLFLSQYELVAARAAGRLLDEAQLAALEGSHHRERAPAAGARYVAGLDFGGDRRDADATVLTIARLRDGACELVELVCWEGAPFAEVASAVEALVLRWRIERLCADGTGLGAPLAARLADVLGEHRVERVVFTAQSKSELGYALLAAANTGAVSLWAADHSAEAYRLRRELRECRASLHGRALLEWGNPAGHDDFAVSLALCLRAAATAGPARIASGRQR